MEEEDTRRNRFVKSKDKKEKTSGRGRKGRWEERENKMK